ncbi:MAG: ATP-binding protein [Ignavibacteria bacterium]|nr:ATP-binding protein [Ignavibacteria bacterium]
MKFTKETRTEYLILAISFILSLCFIGYKVHTTITSIDKETKIFISEAVLNISSVNTIYNAHLQLLKSRAEELLADKNVDVRSIKGRLINVRGKGWELLPDTHDSVTALGRVTGLGCKEDITDSKLREIYIAEKLNYLFIQTRANLRTTPYVYYISKSDYWNITPRHFEPFAFFIGEYHQYDLYTFGLPEHDPDKAVFWTKPYIDAGGNGLMVTAGIPLYNKGEFIGTICMDMLFNDIASYLKSNTFVNRNISLIDDYSQVVSSTYSHLSDKGTIPTLRMLLKDEINSIKIFEINKFVWHNNYRVFVASIPDSQWYILHFTTGSEFLLTILYRVAPTVAAILFLLVILYLLLYTNRLRIENEAARIKAEKANSTKDKFLSIVAHDLRGPFAYLLGFSDLMIENFSSGNLQRQQEIFGHIDTGIKKVYKLLDNLLVWARLQKESITLNPVEIKLHDAVAEAVEPLLQLSENKSISVVNEVPAAFSVHSDQSMLTTVIRNLVSNAIKFTPKRGSVIISAAQKDKFTEISVADSGIGIPRDVLDKLFAGDEKTSTVGTEGESGTGLGLLLCKEFIELHNGRIWAESVPGKGATFYFTIPQK